MWPTEQIEFETPGLETFGVIIFLKMPLGIALK